MTERFQYLRRHEIDTQHWDETVRRNTNGLIYAQSAYLDAMAIDWHAVVSENYASILPIPVRKKFGIRYCFTPAFIQQLGLIGQLHDTEAMAAIVTKKIRYGTLPLNYSNLSMVAPWSLKPRSNRIIDTSQSYETLLAGYKPGARDSIRNALANDLRYLVLEDFRPSVASYLDSYRKGMRSFSQDDFDRFRALCQHYQSLDSLVARGVVSASGDVLASAVLFRDTRRLYFLVNWVGEEGRNLEANYMLLDGIIREFSAGKLLLDLEGSDLPGVQAFYARFGGFDQPYCQHHYNRLLFPLSFLR